MANNIDPIRIAHIMGKWVGGGVEAVVMNYYRHIDRNKIQFDFICDDDSSNMPYEEIEAMGGRVILIPPYQKVFKYQRELKRVLIDGEYTIVHSHINTLSIFPLKAAKDVGIVTRIAHSHSTTNKVEWKKNLLKNILKPFSRVYPTHYFACTEHAGRWLFGNKIFNEGGVFILNNAIDVSKFKYNAEISKIKRAQLGIDNNTLVIGHIGRFVQQKNHHYLIDIFNEVHKKNRNSILVLIGQGPRQMEIINKVKDLGLIEVVKFLGQCEDVHEWYQSFDAFLFPSIYEGLGMVAIEAQCAGCYCLASIEVPSVAKVTNNIEFLDLNQEPKDWAEYLLNNMSNRKSKNYELEVAKQGYDIKTEVKNLEHFYLSNYNGV